MTGTASMNKTAPTVPLREKEEHRQDAALILRSKQRSLSSWKTRMIWAFPVLLQLLSPFSTHFVYNNSSSNTLDRHNNNNSNSNSNSNNKNRQLLEHGLRGGDDAPLNRTMHEHSNNSTTGFINSSIPISNLTIPLHAQSGTHHVHMYIGSPPQKQTLIVDTGSRAMAFPCKTKGNGDDCCGSHASEYFDPHQSSTHVVSKCGHCLLEGISSCFPSLPGQTTITTTTTSGSKKQKPCTFSQKYTEGSSWTATEVEDLVWFGVDSMSTSLETYMPQLAIAYPFGCQTSSKGLFRNQYADGILGLSIHETSLVKALYREDLIGSNAFSLCFTPKGGVLSLGGSLNPNVYHQQPMKTTPITHRNEHGYYSVQVTKLLVGETIVLTDRDTKPRLLKDMNAGKGCILDSGTTDSFFPASLYRPVRKAVVAYGMAREGIRMDDAEITKTITLGEDEDDLFSSELRHREYTFEEFERFLPTLTIVLANGVQLEILPKHYMENVPLDDFGRIQPWENTRKLTNRLYFEESRGSVLGQNAFFGYDILFDAGDDPKIGVAKSDCHSAASHLLTIGR